MYRKYLEYCTHLSLSSKYLVSCSTLESNYKSNKRGKEIAERERGIKKESVRRERPQHQICGRLWFI